MRVLLLPLLALLCALAPLVSATHFRYQSVSTKTRASDNVALVTITQAWRRSAFGVTAVGNSFSPGTWNWGDGSSQQFFNLVVTAIDFTNDWVIGTVDLSHTYPNAQLYTMVFSTCCRISTLRIGANGNVLVSAQVRPGSNNDGPITALPPIVQVSRTNIPHAFNFVATDPNFNTLSYSLSPANPNGVMATPAGFAIDSVTGEVTWPRLNAALGLYPIQVLIFEQTPAGSQVTAVDFLVDLVASANIAPVFVSPTPASGSTVTCPVGTPAVFQLKATDADSHTITLTSNTALSGATLATTSSVPGTVTGTMSYTPLAQQGGSNLAFSITATDQLGASSFITFFCFVPVPLNNPPEFVSPSPASGASVLCPVNTPTVFNLAATDPDGHSISLSLVSPTPGTLSSAAGPTPVSGTLSFTPTVAQYGQSISFTVRATDQLNAFALLTFFCQVPNAPNSPPHFEDPTPDEGSTTNCPAGTPFSFPLYAEDDDGHTITLSLSQGTGTVTGQPSAASVTGSLSFTPTSAQQGSTLSFSVVATDQLGASSTRSFSCQVSTGSSSVNGDPQFAGFHGQSFQFHGLADETFNLISSPQLQLNSHFVYLSSGSCTYNNTLCFQHPGTYLDALGFRMPSVSASGSSADVLVRVTAGSHQDGLRVWMSSEANPEVENEIQLGKYVNGMEWNMDEAGNKATVTYNKFGEVTVKTNMFQIQVVNSHFFFNIAVSLLDRHLLHAGSVRHTITDHEICNHDKHAHAQVDEERAVAHSQHDHGLVERALMHKYPVKYPVHGLVGQTWRNVLICGKHWMGTVQDYVVSSLFGQDHYYYYYGNSTINIA